MSQLAYADLFSHRHLKSFSHYNAACPSPYLRVLTSLGISTEVRSVTPEWTTISLLAVR